MRTKRRKVTENTENAEKTQRKTENVNWLVGQAGGSSENVLLQETLNSKCVGAYFNGNDGEIYIGATARLHSLIFSCR